ncbi:MAG TPA: hypothetical protein VF803_00100, partial [Candidatus Paceibacterota bacterium]
APRKKKNADKAFFFLRAHQDAAKRSRSFRQNFSPLGPGNATCSAEQVPAFPFESCRLAQR